MTLSEIAFDFAVVVLSSAAACWLVCDGLARLDGSAYRPLPKPHSDAKSSAKAA